MIPEIIIDIPKAGEVNTFALHTKYPYLIGRVVCVNPKEPDCLAVWDERAEKLPNRTAKVDGFAIYVTADGCWHGGCDPEDAGPLLREMAAQVRDYAVMGRIGGWKKLALDKAAARAEKRERSRVITEAREAAHIENLKRELFGK